MAYTNAQFFAKIKSDVIADAKRSNILASLTAAQALIESGSGNSGLTQKANNLFGIKGKYNGDYVTMKTQEWSAGKGYYWVNAQFRKYPSWKESIQDHNDFLLRNSRYKNLIGVKDYRTVCVLIHQDGYATSPTYANTLITTIERFNLQSWDQGKASQTPLIDISGSPPIQIGSTGAYVKLLQNALSLRGFPCDPDGILGPATEAMVIGFQRWAFPAQEKEWDGIVGQNTWRALFS